MFRPVELTATLMVLILTAAVPAGAQSDATEVPGVEPERAWEVFQDRDDAVLLDVRTVGEYRFVGHPVGAELVPLLYWNERKRTREPNPDFLEQVEQQFEKDQILIVICRSGNRSERAARLLLEAGFEEVYNVLEGFEGEKDENGKRTVNGWKNAGLPWEY